MGTVTSTRLRDTVYAKLRKQIITGKLMPGELLNDSSLMREFGVGRTPLREAMILLNNDGLARSYPRRGTFVTEVTLAALQKALEIRPSLEALAIRLGVQYATDQELAALKKASESSTEGYAPDEVLEFDFDIHKTIVELSRNEYLFDAWIKVYTACSRLKYLSLSPVQDRDIIQGQLYAIASAMAARDVKGAITLMEEHLAHFIRSVGLFGTELPSN